MDPKIISVFGASKPVPGDRNYQDGVACGRLLANGGYVVATGGYGGLMEAVSKGAAEAGGHVIGVTAPTVFRDRDGANAFVAEDRKAAYLMDRIHQLTEISGGAIVLPGSLGTLTEFSVAWNLAFVARFHGGRAKPVVTVGSTWRDLVEHLGSQLATDTGLVNCVETVDEAVAAIELSVPI